MAQKYQARDIAVTAANTRSLTKNVLVGWVRQVLGMYNNKYGTDYTIMKLEEMGQGWAYVYSMRLLFPGAVTNTVLKKVKPPTKKPQTSNDWYENLRQFQNLLHRVEIKKQVPIDRLVKCRPQDNLEFLQWFYKFFEINETEDLAEARANSPEPAAPAAPSPRRTANTRTAASRTKRTVNTPRRAPETKARAPSVSSSTNPAKDEEIERLTTELSQSCLSAEGLEKERDFYFNKLHDIELMCQEYPVAEEGAEPKNPDLEALVNKIFDIMYATEEGFASPDEYEGDDATEELSQ